MGSFVMTGQQHRAGLLPVTPAVVVAVAVVCWGLAARGQSSLELVRVATGLSSPVYATHAPGDPGRLYVVEKGGTIRILDLAGGGLLSTPFMAASVTSAGIGLTTDGERGLLGLAFHPEYQANGRFYINSTDAAGTTRIREFRRQTADQVDPSSGRDILSVSQPYSNHNGGWLDFGRDGYLYVAMGDGGSGNDPQNHAQNRGSLLGKMLRLDVNGDDFPTDSARNYRVPSTNPFVGQPGMLGEIWAYGLRNPWRNGFDRVTGDLFIGDVGQNAREEINFQPATSSGGENYGWRIREGTLATNLTGQGGSPLVSPIYDYTRGTGTFQGRSVTGGYVYRGPIAPLEGQYFFGDYVSGRLFSLVYDGSPAAAFNGLNFTNRTDWTATLTTSAATVGNIASFAEDAAGHVYVVSYGGHLFRIGLPSLTWSTAGSGTWSAAAWTTASGSSASWTQQRRAIFTAASGTVQVAGDIPVGLGVEFRGGATRLAGATGRLLLTGSTAALNQIDVAAGVTATIGLPVVATVGFVKTGSGSLVLSGSSGPAGNVVVRGGELVAAADAALASGTVRIEERAVVRVGNGLAVAVGALDLQGGLLDVSTGRVTLPAGTFAIPGVVAGLREGRGEGDWLGSSGVTSSAASASGVGSRGVGWVAQVDGSLSLAYAAAGDTNLDWQIDIMDAADMTAAGLFGTGLAATWSQGDFNYDSTFDILDAADFLATGLFNAGAYGGVAATEAVRAVPEPGAPALWMTVVSVAGYRARRCLRRGC